MSGVHAETRDDLIATAAFHPEPAAAAAARRFVRETLRAWQLTGRSAGQDALVDDAVLLTSELVTNAVVHAGTSVQVTCRLAGGAVDVIVLDRHPAALRPDRPHGVAEAAERTSGRGLQLPSELASAWGVTYARSAKAVWFRIGLPGGDGRAGSGPGLPGPGLPGPGLPGPARTCSAADGAAGPVGSVSGLQAGDPPAWARRNLGRLGYHDLLADTVATARAAAGADAAYLLDAGEDGELRVRAAAGAGQPPVTGDPAALLTSTGRLLAATTSSLAIPLLARGRVTGLLALTGDEPGRFRDHDAARLRQFADRVAPALERARLDELERGRRERAAFLASSAELLAAGAGRQNVIAAGASLAVPQLATWCAVLLPAEGGTLWPTHVRHADPSRVDALTWLLERAATTAGFPATQRGVAGAGGAPGPGGAPGSNGRKRPGWRWQLAMPPADQPPPQGVGDFLADRPWCFPMTATGRALGLLAVGGPGGAWLPSEVAEMAAGLARRMAVAIDNVDRQVPAGMPVPG